MLFLLDPETDFAKLLKHVEQPGSYCINSSHGVKHQWSTNDHLILPEPWISPSSKPYALCFTNLDIFGTTPYALITD